MLLKDSVHCRIPLLEKYFLVTFRLQLYTEKPAESNWLTTLILLYKEPSFFQKGLEQRCQNVLSQPLFPS